ncbi:tetratricopeptide repeat protein [Hymenobacter aquaticus]|uniref:tetratricopeptide repeat protein n=1 Tax=Hymenobacter aquaticus TaxID=1867101 RepID=UPI001436BE2C|nr:tetratricopeptide repeat protein [Hymenobacter aquaticus]
MLLLLLLVLADWTSLTRIRDRNAVVQQAQQAFGRGQFDRAAQLYRRAIDELGGAQDELLLLNMGHAYARAGRPTQARAAYGRLVASQQAPVRSIARQQLGVLAAQKGKYAEAVSLLRQALLADPTNTEARYNYEVLRDYLARTPNEPRIPPAPQPKSPDTKPDDAPSKANQPGQDQQGQLPDPAQPDDPRNSPTPRPDPRGQRDPSQAGSGAGNQTADNFQPGAGPQQRVAQGTEPGRTRGLGAAAEDTQRQGAASRQPGTEQASLTDTQFQTQRERLQQMNLSAGQARQLLDALGTAEEQYLQQMPRRTAKKPDPKKPTW